MSLLARSEVRTAEGDVGTDADPECLAYSADICFQRKSCSVRPEGVSLDVAGQVSNSFADTETLRTRSSTVSVTIDVDEEGEA